MITESTKKLIKNRIKEVSKLVDRASNEIGGLEQAVIPKNNKIGILKDLRDRLKQEKIDLQEDLS